jgi:hypothetical protein
LIILVSFSFIASRCPHVDDRERGLRGVCSVVDGVVGMSGAIEDAAARSFAVGFYRASVTAARLATRSTGP